MGHKDIYIFEFLMDSRQPLKQIGYESQSPGLSAKRTLPDFEKLGLRIKISGVKVCHNAFLSTLPPGSNQGNQILPVVFDA